jgi:transcriptional regulator with XRE-family HTH domain
MTGYTLVVTPWSPTARTARRETRLAERITDPIIVPASLWQRPDTTDALRSRDMRRLFHLLRQYAGASQTRIGIACGLTQGKVSAIMSGSHRVTTLEVFERIADGLGMPPQARLALGLAPSAADVTPATAIPSRDGRSPQPLWAPPSALIVDSPGPSEAEDPVRRRTFTRLAGTSLVGALLADGAAGAGSLHGAEALATALVTSGSVPASAQPADLPTLTKVVASAKRAYQACRYTDVMSQMPRLLSVLQAASNNLDGDARLRAYALSADAYHVAASVLLKLDDHGLAWLAADRSMRAATRSQEPLTVGTSARIITHALMADGHFAAATAVAGTHAQRLSAEVRSPTPGSLSVYGSLLLRGALAAARAEDRDGSMTLLNEAGQAGSRLGSDHNHRWTAFGPVNVLLHRINVAVRLGDAGSAITYARRVDLDQLTVTERKASFFMDTAQAFSQWGKHEKALNALRAAEELAPQEVRSRPAVHRLVGDLLATAPPTVRARLKTGLPQAGTHLDLPGQGAACR